MERPDDQGDRALEMEVARQPRVRGAVKAVVGPLGLVLLVQSLLNKPHVQQLRGHTLDRKSFEESYDHHQKRMTAMTAVEGGRRWYHVTFSVTTIY